VSIKDRTVDWPVVVETLQLATYPGMGQGKLEPDYSIREETIAHWEWREARVACTLLAQRTPGR
jgi:hypothetical protein